MAPVTEDLSLCHHDYLEFPVFAGIAPSYLGSFECLKDMGPVLEYPTVVLARFSGQQDEDIVGCSGGFSPYDFLIDPHDDTIDQTSSSTSRELVQDLTSGKNLRSKSGHNENAGSASNNILLDQMQCSVLNQQYPPISGCLGCFHTSCTNCRYCTSI